MGLGQLRLRGPAPGDLCGAGSPVNVLQLSGPSAWRAPRPEPRSVGQRGGRAVCRVRAERERQQPARQSVARRGAPREGGCFGRGQACAAVLPGELPAAPCAGGCAAPAVPLAARSGKRLSPGGLCRGVRGFERGPGVFLAGCGAPSGQQRGCDTQSLCQRSERRDSPGGVCPQHPKSWELMGMHLPGFHLC